METLEIVLLNLGIIEITLGLVLVLIRPEPTPFQLWAFRVLMSLGAVYLGSNLLGFIGLNEDMGELVIQAGGAVALFLLLYLENPPKYIPTIK